MSELLSSQQVLVLLIDLSIKATLFAGLTFAILRVLKVKNPASIHAAWTAVLLGMLVLAPLRLVVPSSPLPILPTFNATVPASRPAAMASGSLVDMPLPAMPSPAAAMETLSVPRTGETASGPRTDLASLPWQRVLVTIYLLGVGFMILRLALGLTLCRRLVLTGRPIQDAEIRALFERLCATATLVELPSLMTSSATRVPLALGFWQPRVFVPEDWRSWDRDKLAAVLAHELAHLRRGDNWTQLLSSVIRSFYWFHPVAWVVSRQVSLLAEQASDDLAIRWTGSRRRYAHHLLEIAAALQGKARVVLGTLPMARRSQVGERIQAILDQSADPARRMTRKGLALMLALAFCGVMSAAAFRLETETASAAPGAEKATRIEDLSSPDVETRARAAFEIWQSGRKAPEVIPALVSLLGDRAAVKAFVDDNDQPIRVRALTTQTTTPGREAARALGSLGEAAVEPAIVALGSPKPEVRQDAAAALGGTHSRRAVQPLISALSDTAPGVRKMAAWALGTIEDPKALGDLTRALQDKDKGVREMASWAHLKVKLRQAEGSAGTNAGASFEELQADLRHRDYRIRIAAAEGLERLADPRAVPALATAVSDSYYGVRIAAAGALGKIGGTGSREALRGALDDSDYRVRLKAATELGRQGDRDALAALGKALRHEHHAVRTEAAHGLGLTRAHAAVDPLIAALDDEDPRVRRMVAWALGNVGDPRAIPALDSALKDDKQEEVRQAVRAALEQLKGETGR